MINNNITLGFNWNEFMSYEEFVEKNKNLDKLKSWEIYKLIEERYIMKKYEDK